MVQFMRLIAVLPSDTANPKEHQGNLISFQKTRQSLSKARENLLVFTSSQNGKKRKLVLYEKIGEGGEQSEVKLARDIDFSRDVVLKFLPANNIFGGNKFILDINSPYVVKGLDIGTAIDGKGKTVDGELLMMEYAAGQTLYDKIGKSLPSLTEARTIFLQIALGLKDIFDMGILYLDLKPSNTMILDGNIIKVKLIDFGISQKFPYDTNGIVNGTVEFVSPEHARGGILYPSSDIFSFGLLMYECLTNKLPEIYQDPHKTLLARANYKEFQITEFKPNTPFWLESLVRRCLRANPDKRPSITEIIETLSTANKWDSIKQRALSYLER